MKTTTLVVLIGVLSAATPARAQNREHLQMAAEIQILRQQNQELANTLAETIKLLNETTKALNTRIDQTNDAMRKGFADQSLTLNTAAGDVRKTLAQTQDAATRLGELKEEVQALRSSLPAMLSRLTVAPVDVSADPNAGPAGAEPAAAISQTASSIGLDPSRMYNTAMSDYSAGKFEAAVQGFQEFLKNFPTSARAATAQQYIGESEFLQNRFEQAIAAYTLVIQNYPKTEQAAWSYYKRGVSQTRLGQTAAARASFEAAVKQFPEIEPGILSLNQLQALDSKLATPPAKPGK
jgi:tol-pal system protein YbgF